MMTRKLKGEKMFYEIQKAVLCVAIALSCGELLSGQVGNPEERIDTSQSAEQQTEGEGKTQIAENEDHESIGTWKEKHRKRLITNQKIASDLRKAAKLKTLEEFRKTITTIEKRLPKNGYYAHRLRSIAKEMREEDATSTTTFADDPNTNEIKSELTRFAEQLSFEMKLEADLPERFAAPTPVGEIEMKAYPPTRVVRTSLGEPSTIGDSNQAFFRLFEHIKKHDIKMTSPVEMVYSQTKAGIEGETMGFYYPHQTTEPAEATGQLEVVDMPTISVIATGFRGKLGADKIEEKAEWLRKHSLKYLTAFKLSTEIRVMGFNGPSTPEEDQFYEVQIKLVKQTKPRLKITSVRTAL